MGIDSGPAMGVVAGSTIPSYCIMSTRGLSCICIMSTRGPSSIFFTIMGLVMNFTPYSKPVRKGDNHHHNHDDNDEDDDDCDELQVI